MARGRIVTPEVRGLIIQVHLVNTKWKAYEVRNGVEAILNTDKQYEKLKPIPKGWPSLSKVQKVLADISGKPPSDEEEPWDISTLSDKHPIPPEALPTVLDIAMSSQERGQSPLTIREAKWIGRLYVLIFAVAAQQGLDKVPMAFVEGMATFYATNERIIELMGERLPASMDEILWKFLTKRETPESISEAYKREFHPGMKDSRWGLDESGALSFMLTKEELRRVNGIGKKLGITLEVKEAQNERQYKTKRQK